MVPDRLNKETVADELSTLIKKKVERMVTVTDDWYPCYPGNQVRVKLSLNYFRGYYVMLSAWGMDDCGVVIERSAADYADALGQYEELNRLYHTIPDGVDRQWFFDHGFKYF